MSVNGEQTDAETPSPQNPSFIPSGARPVASPKTALYHSLTLPGWGQFDNGRRGKAYLFIAAELAFVGGALYQQYRLNDNHLTRYEKDVILSDRNTFIIYWFGARVFGMLDAFVDAQLREFNVRDVSPPGMARP